MDAEQELLISDTTLKLVKMLHENKEPLETLAASYPELAEELDVAADELLGVADILWELRERAARGAKRKKKSKQSGDAYQLKITLKGSKPPIWRRVVVPIEITLDLLHDVIQVAMGWEDAHLHMFHIHGAIYEDTSIEGVRGEEEAEYRLCDLLTGEKDQFSYTYDFGDNWEHQVAVEKLIRATDNPPLMTCTAGKNRGPLEDSGGLWGYYDRLEALSDPTHPEHDELTEWLGGERFDPKEFDPEKVNEELKELC